MGDLQYMKDLSKETNIMENNKWKTLDRKRLGLSRGYVDEFILHYISEEDDFWGMEELIRDV